MLTPRLILPLLLLAFLATAALAQSSTPKPSDDKIEVWTEAMPILERELKAVADAKSMTGSALARWDTQVEGKPATQLDYPIDFALAKPENLYLNTKDFAIFSNGKLLTVYSKNLKQYITRPAPPIWSLRDVIEDLTDGQVRSIPSEALLRPGMTLQQSLRGVRTLEKVRDADHDGKAGVWITGTGFDDRQPSAYPFKLERFYASSDGLLYAVKQDWTLMHQDMATRAHALQMEGDPAPKPAPKILSATWNTTYQRTLNPEIPAERFLFTPGPDDKPVDRFIFPRPNLKGQTALIGQPAPDLAGTDLDGKPVKLADFKGKVVVLDFWSTACGPCVQALPSMRELQKRNLEKPLAIIGVNRDAPGAASRVKRFLTKNQFPIAQFDDSAGRAAAAFGVDAAPRAIILIDKDGIVQDIDLGYIPGKERELSSKIDRLLSGKPLRTPEELAKLRAQVGL